MAASVMDVVEAAYRLDLGERAWLSGLAHSAVAHLDGGHGVAAYLVRNGADGSTRLERYVQTADDARLEQAARTMIAQTPPPAAELFYQTPVGCVSAVEMMPEQARTHFRTLGSSVGVRDLLGVVGLDVSGRALTLGAPHREEIELHPRTRWRWNRVATHLTAALRLRSRLGETAALDDAEAVLEPDGRLVHATAAAGEQTPREILRRRVLAIDRARGPLRHDDEQALELWRALCAGTWSLIETFDSDGRRFMVACRNEPATADRALSRREQQVVAFAAMGHDDALIGYALDLSPDTVRSHVRNAMRKLGVASRLDLIRLVHALRAQPPAASTASSACGTAD